MIAGLRVFGGVLCGGALVMALFSIMVLYADVVKSGWRATQWQFGVSIVFFELAAIAAWAVTHG